MILQGNQRGGAQDLARHLLKAENEHVEVHELRGFVADDLKGALNEAYAISKGTKAKQFLYSLSLNPPQNEKVSTESFEDAIARVEAKLGLVNQPRAVVFHEKNGRRHCHTVWSRTDTQSMTAIHLPHTKRKLMEISRDLYIHHGWNMPQGMLNSELRDPKNFTLSEWQQAKRIGKDPRAIKQAFQDCWAISDNLSSFQHALKERGYILAKGDRRGFVAVDHACEVFAVAKWTGLKTKDVRARLGNEKHLPSVADAKLQTANDMQVRLKMLRNQQNKIIEKRKRDIAGSEKILTQKHKKARDALKYRQEQRWVDEVHQRKARYRKGIRGLIDRVTGRHKQIRKQNELELKNNHLRDQQEKDALIFEQLEERRLYQNRLDRLQKFKHTREHKLQKDIEQYRDIAKGQQSSFIKKSPPKHEI